jgi:hypothetical protein
MEIEKERGRERVYACLCTVVVMPCTGYGLSEKKRRWTQFRTLRKKKDDLI